MSVLDVKVAASRIGADSHVVAIAGEFDLHASEEVGSRLDEIVEGGARSVVVDLIGVTLLDSGGLAVLISTSKALQRRDGELILVVDDRRVLRTIEIAGLQPFFDIRPSLMEAVQDVIDRRLRG
ncbi:MAG: STAS domain-containing protein [Actinobacteria bacterium]|nr:MAG: STAS domain-containing protein [Actinomycetota bacterium]